MDRLYTDYLASGYAPRQTALLASALQARGYHLEAAVLSGTAGRTVKIPGSPWNGRRLWGGTRLPMAAEAGDVWLDTCQLTPMLLVPHEDVPGDDEDIPSELLERLIPFIGWIDTRPVQRWQFAAFLTLARFNDREVQLDPPLRLLDRQRLVPDAENASVTDLTSDEARLCANWFGKSVCHLTAWQAARAFLTEPALSTLWGEPNREWAGAFDEGVHMVVSPTSIDTNPKAEADADVLPPHAVLQRLVSTDAAGQSRAALTVGRSAKSLANWTKRYTS